MKYLYIVTMAIVGILVLTKNTDVSVPFVRPVNVSRIDINSTMAEGGYTCIQKTQIQDKVNTPLEPILSHTFVVCQK